MREVRLHWELFRGEEMRAPSELIMSRLLTLLTFRNVLYLREHPDTPPLLESGIRYVAEGAYNEDWNSVPVILSGDGADCEDLACWRAAELIVSGEDPGARPVFYGREILPGRRLYHVVVRRTTGENEIDDPSRWLGMGKRRGRKVRL